MFIRMKLASFFLVSVVLHSAVVIAYPISLAVAPAKRFIAVTILSYGELDGGMVNSPSADKSKSPLKLAKTPAAKASSRHSKRRKVAPSAAKKQQLVIKEPVTNATENLVAPMAVGAGEPKSPRFPFNPIEESAGAGGEEKVAGAPDGPVGGSGRGPIARGTGTGFGLGASGNGSGHAEGQDAGIGVPQLTPVSFRHTPPPDYPAVARADGKEGRVLVRVLVDEQGKSKIIEIDHSSGSRILDQAAADAIKRWRFSPARYGDTPLASWVKIPVDFRLTMAKE
ncbi:MAG: energy transducer TonB [Deltaproteobacteria bacterium]|nr:energy transducer TonB [Deltaproteobacteria bacterium]